MNRQEVLTTRVGEMQDLIACLSIYNGADPAPKSAAMGFLEQMGVE